MNWHNLELGRTRYKGYRSQRGFQERTFCHQKRKYFSQPLHIESNRTNPIVCFDQPMKSGQSDCLFCSHFEHFGWHKPCCYMSPIFLSGPDFAVSSSCQRAAELDSLAKHCQPIHCQNIVRISLPCHVAQPQQCNVFKLENKSHSIQPRQFDFTEEISPASSSSSVFFLLLPSAALRRAESVKEYITLCRKLITDPVRNKSHFA